MTHLSKNCRSTMAMEGELYNWAGVGILTAILDTVRFYRCLFYFLFGGTYKECPYFNERLQVTTGCRKLSLLRTSPDHQPISQRAFKCMFHSVRARGPTL